MDKLTCKYILFDLDGTLTRSHPGIIRSIQYALEKHGLPVPPEEKLMEFVGPPLAEKFVEVFGVSKEKATEMVMTYRERYNAVGKFECGVFDGIEECLAELKKMGKTLCVATSKPETAAKEVIGHFGMTKYFDLIGGDTDDHRRKNKTAVINYVMRAMNISDKGDVIMIGDTHYDVLGANESGIGCVGVLYGYGDRKSLEEAGACRLAEKPGDITEMFR